MYTPHPIAAQCEKLFGVRAKDRIGRTIRGRIITPHLLRRIDAFRMALWELQKFRHEPGYEVFVSYVLGHRRLVVTGDCRFVDAAVADMLKADPWVIPDDCFADRLPPWCLSSAQTIRANYTKRNQAVPSSTYTEFSLAAD